MNCIVPADLPGGTIQRPMHHPLSNRKSPFDRPNTLNWFSGAVFFLVSKQEQKFLTNFSARNSLEESSIKLALNLIYWRVSDPEMSSLSSWSFGISFCRAESQDASRTEKQPHKQRIRFDFWEWCLKNFGEIFIKRVLPLHRMEPISLKRVR